MKKGLFIAFLSGWCCVITPGAVHAATPQSRQKRVPARAHAAIRKAPKPPKQEQVHRGDVDGSITLIQFVSTRRQHDHAHHEQDQAAPHGSLAQVRASSEHAEPGTSGSLTPRAVESLPPYWASTHLSI